jgi:hypothetical protein
LGDATSPRQARRRSRRSAQPQRSTPPWVTCSRTAVDSPRITVKESSSCGPHPATADRKRRLEDARVRPAETRSIACDRCRGPRHLSPRPRSRPQSPRCGSLRYAGGELNRHGPNGSLRPSTVRESVGNRPVCLLVGGAAVCSHGGDGQVAG